jgi:hypothetical protein
MESSLEITYTAASKFLSRPSMPRIKITEIGKLLFRDDGGLVCSVTLQEELPPVPGRILRWVCFSVSTNPNELSVGDFVVRLPFGGVATFRGRHSTTNFKGHTSEYMDLQYPGDHSYTLGLNYRCFVSRIEPKECRGGKWVKSFWFEALPNAYDWPGLGTFPELPKEVTDSKAEGVLEQVFQACEALNQWYQACEAYQKALHADVSYQKAAHDFVERQTREPFPLFDWWWIYRGKVVRVVDPPISLDRDEYLLLVKQFVLQNERKADRLRRHVESLESAAESSVTIREPIPESVRLFVWRRDNGQCVRCGSRENLEFDHIIPVSRGGSSTERNMQLLCESCNRSKGATV